MGKRAPLPGKTPHHAELSEIHLVARQFVEPTEIDIEDKRLKCSPMTVISPPLMLDTSSGAGRTPFTIGAILYDKGNVSRVEDRPPTATIKESLVALVHWRRIGSIVQGASRQSSIVSLIQRVTEHHEVPTEIRGVISEFPKFDPKMLIL